MMFKKGKSFSLHDFKKGNDAGSLISIRVNRQDIIEGKIERKKRHFTIHSKTLLYVKRNSL